MNFLHSSLKKIKLISNLKKKIEFFVNYRRLVINHRKVNRFSLVLFSRKIKHTKPTILNLIQWFYTLSF